MNKLSNKKYIGIGKVPVGIGAVIKGWDLTEKDYRNPLKLPVVNFRAMTEVCPHDCFHCFTDKNKKTLSLEKIKDVINQLAEMKTHAIDFVGEGEPTVDKDFFEIIEYTASKGIRPTIYTDAAIKMRDKNFVKRVYKSGASVCPKCDSLFNEKYQNWVVGDKFGKYFKQRNEAIKLLMDQGFNRVKNDGTTRLGFDMVVTKKNINEVARTLRFCRENNLWIIFTTYLPSGRSAKEDFNNSLVLTKKDKEKLMETVKKIDKEYGFSHQIWNGSTTMPCVEFMQIYGDGRVSPCVGNETIVGNVGKQSIKELERKILKKFPFLERGKFDGFCPYRPKIKNK